MIPRLYTADGTELLNQIGMLTDCISCTVSEEINGNYTLSLEYPIGGRHWRRITNGNIITAIPNTPISGVWGSGIQNFLITDVYKSIGNTVQVTANHVSYVWSNATVKPFLNNGVQHNLTWVWNKFAENLVGNAGIATRYKTDKGALSPVHLLKPTSAKEFLLSEMIDVFGGVLIFDNTDLRWSDYRGSNRGAVIRYAKNLLSLSVDDIGGDIVTGIYPYYGELASEDTPYIDLGRVLQTGFAAAVDNIERVDLTERFEGMQPPTAAQLEAAANDYIAELQGRLPQQTITVEDVPEITKFPILVGDTVKIEYQDFGISQLRSVSAVEFDVLRERRLSVTFGSNYQNLYNAIAKIAKKEA